MQVEKAQENDKAKLRESVFAKEKTFGEKRYDQIFGNAVNFWVNLLASAGFAFWVRHAGETKIPFSEKTFTPSKTQDAFAGRLEKTFGMDSEKAGSVANIMTLLTPGHIVMIPSVYFGEKYKASIVKYFNRKHYGEDAMQSDELMKRHAQIEAAEKPTVWGAVVARAGTAVINSTITYAVGTRENMLKAAGEKYNIPVLEKFNGLDHITDRVGVAAGEALKIGAPKVYDPLNKAFSKNKKYSGEQIKNAKKYPDADPSSEAMALEPVYNRGLNNLIRYISQDVIYTLIAAGVVHPIINAVKHVIPGMTYKPVVKNPTLPAPVVPAKSYHFDETQVASVPMLPQPSEQPGLNVSSIQNESTLSKRDGLSVAQAGA